MKLFNKGKFLFLAIILASMVFMGCRPYDVPEYVEVGTNETAFIIPLTGKTADQKTFFSEDYLKKNMVAAKRIKIPHEFKKTGYFWFDGKYLPTIAVIKADRTPVSVKWTKDSGDKRVSAESSESIGFTVPISLTAMIKEENTPKFLSKYTPSKSLKDVINSNVNAFVSADATRLFSQKSLEECKSEKNDVIAEIKKDTQEFFEQFGIDIIQFGTTDGLTYDNPEIQEQIDQKAKLQAEGKALIEKENNAIQRRLTELNDAQNAAKVAREKAASVSSLKKLQEIENEKILAEAQAEALKIAAQNVKLPNVVPENTFNSLNLDRYVPSANLK